MKKVTTSVCIAVLVCILCCLAACVDVPQEDCAAVCPYCKKCTDSAHSCRDKCECEPLNIEHTSFKMLEGTPYETEVHRYVTNKEGPGIVIVGGIHGDETAGWTAGTELVEALTKEEGIRGKILLIPKANIMADDRRERFPGRSQISGNGKVTVDGVTYSDINRAFPVERQENILTDYSLTVAEAIRETVETFIADYGADYIVDLHEAQKPYPSSLGNTLIYSNQSVFMARLLRRYNDVYRPDDEAVFSAEPAIQKGSFSRYFTVTYPQKAVFTVETNRGTIDGRDTVALDVRVRQQLNILKALFDLAWDR